EVRQQCKEMYKTDTDAVTGLQLPAGKYRFLAIRGGDTYHTDDFVLTPGATHTINVPRPPISADPSWVPLFNNKDLTGWKFHPNRFGDWQVENGILTGQGPVSTLFTERGDYKDFHLLVEASIND